MAYVSTSDEKNRILKNQKNKLREEISAKQHQLGLRDMIPLVQKNEYEQLKDIQNEGNHIQQQMLASAQKRKKKNEEARKAKRKSSKQMLKMILMHQERKAKESFDKRRIEFKDGGFEYYIDKLKMTPYRILLKQIGQYHQKQGIVIPDSHFEKRKKYKVLSIGDGCDQEIKIDDIVQVQSFAGIQIISKQNKYLIVYDINIILKYN